MVQCITRASIMGISWCMAGLTDSYCRGSGTVVCVIALCRRRVVRGSGNIQARGARGKLI